MTGRQEQLRIVVSGMVAGDPCYGGATWAVLQYVLGAMELGHDVYLVEPLSTAPTDAVVSYFDDLVDRFGLRERAALLWRGQAFGAGSQGAQRAATDADVVLNVAGMLTDDKILDRARATVYLDLDPAFVQMWHTQGIDMRLDGHSHFATVGLNVGRGSSVPTCGKRWIHTLPPVVLASWPAVESAPEPAFTTVASWRGYGSVVHQGTVYGQKVHSLRPLLDLPARSGERFRLALRIHPDETSDIAALEAGGWELVDPLTVTATPAAYRAFVQSSWAEFGLAKHGYVASACGWFSDRSACYLASGRPVVAHDTGFRRHLPVGEGLFAFTTAGDVVNAADQLRADYPRHARAARELAETHFDARQVLPRLLEAVA